MGIMVYSLLWVMQDLYHQPYVKTFDPKIRTTCMLGALGEGQASLLWVFGSASTHRPLSRSLLGFIFRIL